MNAILTLSNQLVALPTHIPYSLQRRLARHIDCFHISWVSILTEASILLRDKEAMDPEQLWTLHEVVRYLEHPSSGVRRFDQMNEAWRPLVLGVNKGQVLDRTSQDVERTVAGWHQQERDVCLILSGLLGERVRLRLSRRHQAESETRVADACHEFVDSHELHWSFVVPNAAGDIEVRADLQRRTITCVMRLDAPGDRKRATARINWLGPSTARRRSCRHRTARFLARAGGPDTSVAVRRADRPQESGRRPYRDGPNFVRGIHRQGSRWPILGSEDLRGGSREAGPGVLRTDRSAPASLGRRHHPPSSGRTWAVELRQRLVIRRPTAERVRASDRAVCSLASRELIVIR